MEEIEEEKNGSDYSDSSTSTNVTSPALGRRRIETIWWMKNYVSRKGLSEDEDEVQATCYVCCK